MIYSLLLALKDNLQAFLLPSICAYCKVFMLKRTIFCTLCMSKIIPIVSQKIDVTASFSMTVFAISDYKDPLKKLILAKGWSDSLASYYMGQLLWKFIPLQQFDYDVIVPIPLHWTRYAWRGFNQAHEIARVIQRKKNVPVEHLLKRVKKTEFQSTLASNMRVENLKEAFALSTVNKQDFVGKHILLIDDLMTTGSTLRAAAKELLVLKPRKITVVVVCRVV
ncbi:MAG TPA: phosphoribosyltransferase family protein [Candidatus Babeliales bacterium]|nr:phosphoribosyltransferase family protein [Candidatus Babeliales bacterium]